MLTRTRCLMVAVICLIAAILVPAKPGPAGAEDEVRLFDLFDGDAPADDWQNTYLLSLLSHYAYDGNLPGDGSFGPRFRDAFAQHGLERMIELDESYAAAPVFVDTQGMVVETNDAVIVVIRGTEQPADALTDGLIVPFPLDQTHSGFRFASWAVLDQVRVAVGSTDKPVWFTGHSLGGAVTQDLAYQMRDDEGVDIRGVVTFGQPQTYAVPGIASTLYLASPLLGKTELWLNDNDPVPHAVGTVDAFYTFRFGAENHIRIDGDSCSRKDGYIIGDAALIFDDHDTKRYATRILNLMPAADRQEFAQFTNRPGGGIQNPPRPVKPVVSCDAVPDFPGGITAHVDGDLSTNGAWFTSDISVSWRVRDLGLILISDGCGDSTITADRNGDTLTCTVTNQEGQVFSESVFYRRDTTPPEATITFNRPPNDGLWFNEPVQWSVTGTDEGSGVAFCDKDGFYGGPDRANLKLITQGCTDNADNRGIDRKTFRYDATPPAVTIASPAPGARYLLGQTVLADYACVDATSGVATCDGPVLNRKPVATDSFGKSTFAVTATDEADNAANQTATYQVDYALVGDLTDLSATTLNELKAGHKLNLNWQLADSSGSLVTRRTELFDIGWSEAIDCSVPIGAKGPTIDDPAEVKAAGSSYKAKVNTSKAWSGTCRDLVLVVDGAQVTYRFSFS